MFILLIYSFGENVENSCFVYTKLMLNEDRRTIQFHRAVNASATLGECVFFIFVCVFVVQQSIISFISKIQKRIKPKYMKPHRKKWRQHIFWMVLCIKCCHMYVIKWAHAFFFLLSVTQEFHANSNARIC